MISGWNCSFSSDPSKLPSLPVNKQGRSTCKLPSLPANKQGRSTCKLPSLPVNKQGRSTCKLPFLPANKQGRSTCKLYPPSLPVIKQGRYLIILVEERNWSRMPRINHIFVNSEFYVLIRSWQKAFSIISSLTDATDRIQISSDRIQIWFGFNLSFMFREHSV